MANASFVVYIDESGDEGFNFGKGASEWFVLSSVITRKGRDIETVKLIDRVRSRLGKPPKKPLHFRDIRHEHRLPYIGEISQSPIRAISVMVHKPSLNEPEKFREPYRLHHYTLRFLLERVSWCCRDYRRLSDGGDGSVEIVFSNRAGMSYQEIRDYLNLLHGLSDVWDVRIDWNVINTGQISTFTPGKRMGLQIADAIASSVFYAVNPSRLGYTEDRYVRMLKPVTYHHRGEYVGYGLKFYPREVAALVNSDKNLKWVKEVFGR